MTEQIKSLAGLKKWAEEAKYALHKKEGNEDDPDWYVIDADQVLEKINELEKNVKELQKDALKCIAKNVYSDSKLHVGFDCKDCSLGKAEICLNVSDVFKVILGDDKSG